MIYALFYIILCIVCLHYIFNATRKAQDITPWDLMKIFIISIFPIINILAALDMNGCLNIVLYKRKR